MYSHCIWSVNPPQNAIDHAATLCVARRLEIISTPIHHYKQYDDITSNP